MATRPEERMWAIAFTLAGLIVLALAFWLERLRKSLRIPAQLISIECKPFRFVRVRKGEEEPATRTSEVKDRSGERKVALPEGQGR